MLVMTPDFAQLQRILACQLGSRSHGTEPQVCSYGHGWTQLLVHPLALPQDATDATMEWCGLREYASWGVKLHSGKFPIEGHEGGNIFLCQDKRKRDWLDNTKQGPIGHVILTKCVNCLVVQHSTIV